MLNFCCVILLYTRVVLGQTLCLGEQWCTIVDEPEVYEDRDPAQREAEGPKSSMDYSEFFISTKKKNRRARTRAVRESNCRRSHARVKQRPLQSAHSDNVYYYHKNKSENKTRVRECLKLL